MDTTILKSLVMKYGVKIGLKSSQKDCLWHLLDFDFNGKTIVWPGQKTIGIRLGLERERVRELIKSLEKVNLIRVEKNRGKNHKYVYTGVLVTFIPFYTAELEERYKKATENEDDEKLEKIKSMQVRAKLEEQKAKQKMASYEDASKIKPDECIPASKSRHEMPPKAGIQKEATMHPKAGMNSFDLDFDVASSTNEAPQPACAGTAPFPETANQPQDQKQEQPNAEPLPTETRSDCAAPPTGGLRSYSERPEPSVDSARVGEDFPSWKRYVMAYYETRDGHSVEKHLKAADRVSELTGEKVAAWCARCGTFQEWLRSNVDGTFAGKTNGRSYSNGHSNGHANGNGKAAPQFKPAAAPAPTIDEKTLVLMAVIAQVTFKNLAIKQHSELCQAAAVELAKVGATCEIITAKFGANSWWYQKDWRGQKGSCPTPAQLIEVWGQWENTNGATGANGTTHAVSRNGFIPGRPCQWKGDDGDGTPKPVRTSKRTYDV